MRFALVNGEKKDIEEVERGTIGVDPWYKNYRVLACKGAYMKYWRYLDERPTLPNGYENETEWHSMWKSAIKKEYCEVFCGDNNEHRADILTPNTVIEIQYSSISIDKAIERTNFYRKIYGRKMIWVVNVYHAYKKNNLHLKDVFDEFGKKSPYSLLKWKHYKKWVLDIIRLYKCATVYLDVSPIEKFLYKTWSSDGKKIYVLKKSKEDFFNDFFDGYATSKQDFLEAFTNYYLR